MFCRCKLSDRLAVYRCEPKVSGRLVRILVPRSSRENYPPPIRGWFGLSHQFHGNHVIRRERMRLRKVRECRIIGGLRSQPCSTRLHVEAGNEHIVFDAYSSNDMANPRIPWIRQVGDIDIVGRKHPKDPLWMQQLAAKTSSSQPDNALMKRRRNFWRP
jgi:hypothetical protein